MRLLRGWQGRDSVRASSFQRKIRDTLPKKESTQLGITLKSLSALELPSQTLLTMASKPLCVVTPSSKHSTLPRPTAEGASRNGGRYQKAQKYHQKGKLESLTFLWHGLNGSNKKADDSRRKADDTIVATEGKISKSRKSNVKSMSSLCQIYVKFF